MTFISLVFRVFVVLALVAYPIFNWRPPLWLIIFCFGSAALIFRYGIFSADTVLLRTLPILATGFLALISTPYFPLEIPPSLMSDRYREYANLILNALSSGITAEPIFAICFTVIFLSISGVESWRLYLSHRPSVIESRLLMKLQNGIVWRNHVGYVLEIRTAITNQTLHDLSIKSANIKLYFFLPTKKAVLSEIVNGHVVGLTQESGILLTPRREKIVLISVAVDQPISRLLLRLNRPVLRNLPVFFEVKVMEERLKAAAYLLPNC